MKGPKLFRYIKELYFRYINHEVPALGAQTAYYFLLSIFPFLVFLMTIIGYSPISSQDVLDPLTNILPYQAFKIIEDNVRLIVGIRNLKLMSIGFATTLWAASNGVGAMIRGINKAYDTEEKRPFWKIKLVSLLFTIALPVMILLYFLLLIFGHKLGNFMLHRGVPSRILELWDSFRYVVIIVMMIIVFAALYHFTPTKRLRWREVMPGAIFTTIGWLLTSIGFAYYVNNYWNITLVYGSIGGIMALLIWLFLSAVLIIMGGEINAVLVLGKESKI